MQKAGQVPIKTEYFLGDKMDISSKLNILLKRRNLTPSELTKAANLSRATMSRIMRGHMPAEDTLSRIAAVLEVSPGYLKGGYTLPVHLTEEDVLTLADLRNLTFLRMVREAAERGLTAGDLRNLMGILLQDFSHLYSLENKGSIMSSSARLTECNSNQSVN